MNRGEGDAGAQLLEQYKLYVDLTDRIAGRRDAANAFFLTLHTAAAAAVGFLLDKLDRLFSGWTLLAVVVPLVALCWAWWLRIRSYRQLNTGRYKVIHELERRLPANIYRYEWTELGDGRDSKRYVQLTRAEKLIPGIFAALYVALAMAVWLRPEPPPTPAAPHERASEGPRIGPGPK